MEKTALVLSAGGAFGAYQIGVWKQLEKMLQPDLVVGTSIGSLHAWCIAGGAPAAELEALWLDEGRAPRFRLRVPRSWRQGVFDPRHMQEQIRGLHQHYQPRLPVGIVCTGVRRLQQQLFVNEAISWHHLAGSCAIPGVLDLPRLDGATYADGGLFDSINAWAAVEMGATRIVAVNAWRPKYVAWVDGPLGWLAERRRRAGAAARGQARGQGEQAPVPYVLIQPEQDLGTFRDSLRWRPENVRHWMRLGEEDAMAKKQNLCAMF